MSAQPSARERLLATATTLFYDRGITATGVDTVVAESGVSKPTLYAHFRTKEQLVAAVLADRHARRRDELPAWVEAHARTPRARLLAVFDWLEEYYADGGARGCAFVNAAVETPDRDSPARRTARQQKTWQRDYLESLARAARLRRPHALAVQLQLLMEGVHARVAVDGDPELTQEAIAQARAAARTLVRAAS